jgi:hypothetical protein
MSLPSHPCSCLCFIRGSSFGTTSFDDVLRRTSCVVVLSRHVYEARRCVPDTVSQSRTYQGFDAASCAIDWAGMAKKRVPKGTWSHLVWDCPLAADKWCTGTMYGSVAIADGLKWTATINNKWYSPSRPLSSYRYPRSRYRCLCAAIHRAQYWVARVGFRSTLLERRRYNLFIWPYFRAPLVPQSAELTECSLGLNLKGGQHTVDGALRHHWPKTSPKHPATNCRPRRISAWSKDQPSAIAKAQKQTEGVGLNCDSILS